MSQLPLLDVEKLSKDLNLKNSAAEAADNQSMSATDKNRDTVQQAIIQHMGQVLTDTHTQVKQVLNNHVDKRTSIQQHIDIARRQNLADLAIVEVGKVLNETKEALVATQTRASSADRTNR
jgi:hypothetical protein